MGCDFMVESQKDDL